LNIFLELRYGTVVALQPAGHHLTDNAKDPIEESKAQQPLQEDREESLRNILGAFAGLFFVLER
jgi:hypothetical protein